jgi:hypothetical protein
MIHRKATWRVEIQGLVCLLYVAAGTEFPDRVPELTLQVSWLFPTPCSATLRRDACSTW